MCSQVVSFHSHTSSLREMRLYSVYNFLDSVEKSWWAYMPRRPSSPSTSEGIPCPRNFLLPRAFSSFQLLPSILVIFTCLTTLPYSYLGSFYFRFCLGYGVCFIWIQLPFVSYPSSFLFFPFKPPREKKKILPSGFPLLFPRSELEASCRATASATNSSSR